MNKASYSIISYNVRVRVYLWVQLLLHFICVFRCSIHHMYIVQPSYYSQQTVPCWVSTGEPHCPVGRHSPVYHTRHKRELIKHVCLFIYTWDRYTTPCQARVCVQTNSPSPLSPNHQRERWLNYIVGIY